MSLKGFYNNKSLLLILVLPLFCLTSCDFSPREVAKEDTINIGNSPLHYQKKVLIVHSYHKDYEWTAGINRGIYMTIGSLDVDIETVYMDTKRNTSEEWKLEAGKKALETTYNWDPDIIIAADDNAQKYFAKKLIGRERPQVVFCGVNSTAESYGYPTNNITGALEKVPYKETLDLFKSISPKASKLLALSDYSLTSISAVNDMKTHEINDFTVNWQLPKTVEEWKLQITKAQDKYDAIVVYTYHTLKEEGNKQSANPKEVMQWTVENSKLPIISMVIFALDDGALLGVVESGLNQGKIAGKIAKEMIINDKIASDFTVADNSKATKLSMLNLETAKRLGINIPKSIISNIDLLIGEKNE